MFLGFVSIRAWSSPSARNHVINTEFGFLPPGCYLQPSISPLLGNAARSANTRKHRPLPSARQLPSDRRGLRTETRRAEQPAPHWKISVSLSCANRLPHRSAQDGRKLGGSVKVAPAAAAT